MPQSRAPLIVAIVLLLLPVLYVGSYFALLKRVPLGQGAVLYCYPRMWQTPFYSTTEAIFWPLEQIDRKVRPGAWNRFSSLYDEAIAD